MKGYKGFGKGLVCKGKQYAENTVFEEAESVICEKGMHFCENPFDVLDYYSLLNADCEFNEFTEVEALGEAKTDDSKKYCTDKLRVGAKLSFPEFVNACVSFVVEKTRETIPGASSGDGAKIGSSGYGAQIKSEGQYAVVCCAGNNSVAAAKVGSWITLAEWKLVDGQIIPVCVKAEQVDGERIKADTFYMLANGEFVEAKNG